MANFSYGFTWNPTPPQMAYKLYYSGKGDLINVWKGPPGVVRVEFPLDFSSWLQSPSYHYILNGFESGNWKFKHCNSILSPGPEARTVLLFKFRPNHREAIFKFRRPRDLRKGGGMEMLNSFSNSREVRGCVEIYGMSKNRRTYFYFLVVLLRFWANQIEQFANPWAAYPTTAFLFRFRSRRCPYKNACRHLGPNLSQCRRVN